MLPVLFTLRIAAGLAPWLAVLAVVAVAAGRAFAASRGEGERGFGPFLRALRGDGWFVGPAAAAVLVGWRSGILRGPLDLPLHSYGLLLALAFVLGVLLAQREARRRGQDPQALGDLLFWILVAGLAGSEIYYVLLNLEEFSGARFWAETPFGTWPRFLVFWQTGLVFYGGVIGAGLTAFLYMRWKRMAFLPYADTLVPSLAFGHFLGRIGCFAAGCCWGSRAGEGVPWSVQFPRGSLVFEAFSTGAAYGPGFLSADHAHTAALHPSQLYEAFGELAIFLLLVLAVRPRKRFHGQVLTAWLVAYAVLRGGVELFRGDLQRTLTLGLNSGQWTSVAILAVGAAVWVFAPKPPAGADGTSEARAPV